MRKKVLVTGCAGFIGSHLTDALLNKNLEVIGVDNLSTGNLKNIEHNQNKDNFKFYNIDLSNYLDVFAMFKKNPDIECIFHQAAHGSIQKSFESPRNTFVNNVNSFDIILNACVAFNIKKIIFASSSSVYGGREYDVKVEGREEKIISPYAMSKYLNEKQAESYGQIYNIKWYGLRYFNVFGKRQDYTTKYSPVVAKWAHLMSKNKDIEVTGPFDTERDFTYIDNVIHANMLCYYSKDSFHSTCYNIGCGEAVSLKTLYDDLKNLLRSSSSTRRGVMRPGERKKSVASLRKSENLLGYKPIVEYKEGLRKLCLSMSSEMEQ